MRDVFHSTVLRKTSECGAHLLALWKGMKLRMAQTCFGRVLLHLLCCLRRPGHFWWHWHGIERELAKVYHKVAARSGTNSFQECHSLAINRGKSKSVQTPKTRLVAQ